MGASMIGFRRTLERGRNIELLRPVPSLVVAAALLLTALWSAALAGERYYVQADTQAYSDTSSLSAPVADLTAGQEVEALERWASWVRVRFGPGAEDFGWVVVQKLGREPPLLDRPAPETEGTSESATEFDFVLKVTADHAMEVRVRCDLVNERGETAERFFRRKTPVNFRFRETLALSCRLRDAEHLESQGLAAELLAEGRRIAAARTDAVYARELRLRSNGPWGPAGSQVCRARTFTGDTNLPGVILAVDCRDL